MDDEYGWVSSEPEPNRVRLNQNQGLPNPNIELPKPEVHSNNYGQRGTPNQGVPQPSRRPPQGQRPQGQRPQGQRPQGQRPQGQRPQGQRPQGQRPQGQRPQPQPTGTGGKGKVIAILLILVVIVAGIGLFLVNKKKQLTPQNVDYTTRDVYKSFENTLHNFDAESIDNMIGTKNGDSYIAQEWAYVNEVKIRQDFIKTILNQSTFKYPQMQQLSTSNKVMTDSSGNPIMIDSDMKNGTKLEVEHPDYVKITENMESDREYIKKLFNASGYKDTDYTWYDEMTELFMQYYIELKDIPMTTSEITLNVTDGKFDSDAPLDDLLFGSEEFRGMVAKFSQCCLGYTGFKDETYYEDEEQPNPEYDEWLKIFIEVFTADGGTYNPETGEFKGYENFHKGVSKWEPWYVYDENNVLQKNPDGTNKVKYYSVKREDGTDWIQPSKTIVKKVQKTRKVEDKWVEETGIRYNFIGQHYLQTEYKGEGSTVTRVGDGTVDKAAGVGTSIITKVLCSDGKYHDVSVTLTGYWLNQDAIDYVEKFSPKNRGLSNTSLTKIITYEFKVQNLEDKEITFNSEMSLADGNSNLTARTGTMYGFTSSATLKPHESVLLNDWASSTELDQKYVVWGKSFERKFSMVYFKVLAGTGEVPTYSAYLSFTGNSSMDEIPVKEDY